MSFEAAAWAIRQSTKTATEKLVLISLCDHHNKSSGRCDPSIATLAKDALCSQRQAIRCVESLIEQGFIQAKKVTGKRTIYRLNPKQTRDADVTGDIESPVTPMSPVGAATRDTHVTGPVTPMSPEPGSNQVNTHSERVMEAFKVWDQYRKTIARRAPWTDRAQTLSLNLLARAEQSGHDPMAIVDLSIERGYRGLIEPKQQPAARRSRNEL